MIFANRMRIIRAFGDYFKYSLHDARVQKIEHKDDRKKISRTSFDKDTENRIRRR